MPEFECHLGDAIRPTALVAGSQPENKMVPIKSEILGVEKQNLPHMALKSRLRLLDLYVIFLRGRFHDLPKIFESLRAREVLRLQDDFVFVILDPVFGGILDVVLRHGENQRTGATDWQNRSSASAREQLGQGIENNLRPDFKILPPREQFLSRGEAEFRDRFFASTNIVVLQID